MLYDGYYCAHCGDRLKDVDVHRALTRSVTSGARGELEEVEHLGDLGHRPRDEFGPATREPRRAEAVPSTVSAGVGMADEVRLSSLALREGLG
jgi:hypothetical protein